LFLSENWFEVVRVMLQLKNKINIRELDRVLSTKYLPYIYWANGPCYTKPSLL